MPSRIRKAIIPVAGLGTRFLPATKAQPKEMLSVVDKPVIQYIVEEAVESGIEEIIFVTSQAKRAIEDHFDRNAELETRLREKGKTAELEQVLKISELAKFAFVRQKEPKGNGHAILQALPFLDLHEPVAVLFGDDIIDHQTPCLKQLIDAYDRTGTPIIAVMDVPKEQVKSYGVIAGSQSEERLWRMTSIIEKPKPEEAPSTLAVVGRYILTPDFLTYLPKTKPGKDGEIGITDTITEYLRTHSIHAYRFEGDRYDCGNKAQFLAASVMLGLKHPDTKDELKKFLATLAK